MTNTETQYIVDFIRRIMCKNNYTEQEIRQEFGKNVLWYDNAGRPEESPIIKVGYDPKDETIFLSLDTGSGTVTVHEEDPAFRDKEAMEAVFDSLMEDTGNGTRICDECGKRMISGYWDSEHYYCSDECLGKHYTDEEWKEACLLGLSEEDIEEGETCGDHAYWTEYYY